MDEDIKTIEQLIELGNEGAPQEWLDNLTGEGIGGGMEGIEADAIATILADMPEPERAIQADYETSFHGCNPSNYTKGRGGNSVQYIVIHYTAGSQTAEGAARANCIYFGRERVGASAHYFVDDGYVVWQSVPEEDTAWHAGNWAVNQRSIGIEVCTARAYTEAETERLAWLVQRLMDKHGIPASRVIRHYDVTGKRCPAHYVDAARWAALHARITGGSVQQPPSANVGPNLDVDGYFGPATVRACQSALGTTVDGIVSGQARGDMIAIGGVPTVAWRIGPGGSQMIRALQRKAGAVADGYCGPNTVRALQRHLGTPVDGVLSRPSLCVKELQRRLNAGHL